MPISGAMTGFTSNPGFYKLTRFYIESHNMAAVTPLQRNRGMPAIPASLFPAFVAH
ncbi:hypothetical protein THIOM_001187 [Candidatus Thiomargarita nelsonii]|uniref:Uncharacterized protein n=1 Tax=Candidatus Thiomargarita nelsonii TaxID=1003181 RepID=A0A176S4R0_9GAMM|nr:hypothetical protein THIOM_001187 [Candidatus Thiomargarita nelsonii]